MTKECPNPKSLKDTRDGIIIWSLGFEPWDFLGHWVLKLGHSQNYFSSTFQYASLTNFDQLAIRNEGDA